MEPDKRRLEAAAMLGIGDAEEEAIKLNQRALKRKREEEHNERIQARRLADERDVVAARQKEHRYLMEMLAVRNTDDNVLCCYINGATTLCARFSTDEVADYEFCAQHAKTMREKASSRAYQLKRLDQFFAELNKEDELEPINLAPVAVPPQAPIARAVAPVQSPSSDLSEDLAQLKV